MLCYSDLQRDDCIDVTMQLQAMVKDSKLISAEADSKVSVNVMLVAALLPSCFGGQ